ncbi:MAG: AAA family ATPase, partial [Chloroflexales bacterium]|nr:AAA family ATPase [Chloroflexales bacterium]
TGLAEAVAPQPWPALPEPLANAVCQPWLLPAVAARLEHTPETFLAELRPAVALMLAFPGRAYDGADGADGQLDALIRWVQRVVSQYGGAVIDLNMAEGGSSGYLYAAWGAPEAHDDDAVRAIAAARVILTPPPKLAGYTSLRIGMTSGMLWSGAYGGPTRRTYGVLGDATNLAFRLMRQAPDGAIWCDYAVMRAAERRWRFTALPPVRVKGKAGLIRVYAPMEPSQQRGIPATSTLAGRDAEQAQLAAALDAVATGSSRVVVLEGEAGIGKSRLVAALAQQIRARGLVGLLGAGQSIERQTPYRAWRDIIGSFFGLDGVTDVAAQQALVEATVQALRPDLLGRLPLLNDVLFLELPETLQTRALEPAQRGESLTSLLIALLSTWAGEQPLIIVLEDVHWLDSRSWDVALRVARALVAEQLPLLLLVTTRSHTGDEAADAARDTLLTLDGAEHIRLGALPDAAIHALAAARLDVAIDQVDDEVVALIQRRAGGNPFFAEELVDTLREEALIQADPETGARYVASAALAHEEHVLPDTLQGLLLARMDRLAPDEQLTLKAAAVVGATFPYPPLHHVRTFALPTDDAALRHHLGALVAQEFTAQTAQEPELTYQFRHMLVHEATYQTLLYAQRRSLHRTVAEWYEGDGGTPLSDRRSPLLPLLAHHYRYAEDRARERHYARLAGLQAADQYANREALAYFTRALELTPPDDLVGRFDLHRERLNIHRRQEQMAVVVDELDLMEPLAKALDDNACRAFCAVQRAWYAWHKSDYPGAIAAARSVIPLAHAADQPGITTEACRIVALALWRQGDFTTAHAQNEMVLRLAREQGDKLSEAQALNTIGCNLMDLSDYVSAREVFQAALQLSVAIGNQAYESMALRNLGGIALKMCDYNAARVYYLESLRVARAVGVTTAERTIPKDLGEIAQVVGDYDTAIVAYQESLLLIDAVGDLLLECEIYSELARLWWKRGAYATALGYVQRALGIARTIGSGPLEADVLTTQGHIAQACEQYTQAQQSYQTVLDWRQAMGQSTRLHEARAGLARVALAMSDLPCALLHVTAILPGLATGALNSAAEPSLIELTCYQVLAAANDPRATAVLEEAYARLQHIHQSLRDV